jgi:hypothetical protein
MNKYPQGKVVFEKKDSMGGGVKDSSETNYGMINLTQSHIQKER